MLCAECARDFRRSRMTQRFCSARCRVRAHRRALRRGPPAAVPLPPMCVLPAVRYGTLL